MKRYHINPKTGRANVCHAKKMCRFAVDGVEPKHYANKAEAREDAEDMLEEEHGGSFGNARMQRRNNAVAVVEPEPEKDVEKELEEEIRGENKRFNPEFVESQLDMMTENYNTDEEKKELAELERLRNEQEEKKGWSGIRQRWNNFKNWAKAYSENLIGGGYAAFAVSAPAIGIMTASAVTSSGPVGMTIFAASLLPMVVPLSFGAANYLTESYEQKKERIAKQKQEKQKRIEYKQEAQKRKMREKESKQRLKELEERNAKQLEA